MSQKARRARYSYTLSRVVNYGCLIILFTVAGIRGSISAVTSFVARWTRCHVTMRIGNAITQQFARTARRLSSTKKSPGLKSLRGTRDCTIIISSERRVFVDCAARARPTFRATIMTSPGASSGNKARTEPARVARRHKGAFSWKRAAHTHTQHSATTRLPLAVAVRPSDWPHVSASPS